MGTTIAITTIITTITMIIGIGRATEDYRGLTISSIMNEVTLDGTVLFGASGSWSSGDNASRTVVARGYLSFDDAKVAVINQARLFGWMERLESAPVT